MNKKEEFKAFVKKHPGLVKYVNNGTMTWQRFYEMYDMYGDDNSVWRSYLSDSLSSSNLFDFVKNMDFDTIQSGVNSLQRVISLLQEMSSKGSKATEEDYTPRPLYKHFED
ncbi:MAG: hypothetical protein IKF82_07150 [Bacilli bacterium]|nr:hypothetical protein [Bacilli bacterium]